MLHLTLADCMHAPLEEETGNVARKRRVVGEIWCARNTGWGFMHLSDSGCIDRATCMCYIPSSPLSSLYQPLPPVASCVNPSPPIDPPASMSSTLLTFISSHSLPPWSDPPANHPLRTPPRDRWALSFGPHGLYVMSKCCEIIARKSDWQQTRNSSTNANECRGNAEFWFGKGVERRRRVGARTVWSGWAFDGRATLNFE